MKMKLLVITIYKGVMNKKNSTHTAHHIWKDFFKKNKKSI